MKVIVSLHLKPLPGSPNFLNFEDCIDHAVRNAILIENCGADAIIIENFNDKPFFMKAPPETIASMSVIVREVIREVSIPVGVNVLRNDGVAALAIAKAAGAKFVRVNQMIFPAAMPEGFAKPIAAKMARYKRLLNCDAKIFADISVKHSVQLAKIEDFVDNIDRAYCDAVIVTGKKTGKPPEASTLRKIKELVDVPVILGSGATPENLRKYEADGVIVGTYVKEGEEYSCEKLKRVVSEAKKLGGELDL
ncbi:photosystem I assembly BtpA [Ferroglobus placidus DSM 10642]|uniref:Photosystem I assembly BtpA n=1 Tax=Ferroglobus placidus (strain DSM 10642 / AEDII12DO) TaxID=589924 RepID=D3RXR6_FERPA|nr:BtpA/SgcQ family protein [Ferroglobus placidus]ADC65279.1 photosystem I assembly BtpA [Ferroglobus placidus DSM 10642]